MLSPFSRAQLLTTPWAIAHHAPLSMGFSRQEYWSGLPWHPPGDIPNPGIEPKSPAFAGGFFTTEPLLNLFTVLLLFVLGFLATEA